MSTRFIVIAAQAEAASQVSDDFAALVPASTLARVSAAGTSTSEAITSDPEQALPRVVEDIRSHTEDIVLIDALPEGSVSTFDTLGWNLDVAASTNARVIAAFDTEGASPELIEREIEVLDRRARQHATRVAAVALPSAVASHVKTQLPVLELPFNAQTLDATSALEAPQVVTPLSFQADLIDRARSNRKRIVLPEPEDDRVLRAAAIVLERGIADLVLLGDAQAINARAAELGLDVSAATVVSVDDPAYAERYAEEFARLRAKKGVTIEQARDKVRDVSYFGTMMVHMGDADGMVSGAIHTTAHTIVPSFQIIKTAPGVSIVSSVFLMLLKDRVWAFGDCAVNPHPTPEQRADIAIRRLQCSPTRPEPPVRAWTWTRLSRPLAWLAKRPPIWPSKDRSSLTLPLTRPSPRSSFPTPPLPATRTSSSSPRSTLEILATRPFSVPPVRSQSARFCRDSTSP